MLALSCRLRAVDLVPHHATLHRVHDGHAVCRHMHRECRGTMSREQLFDLVTRLVCMYLRTKRVRSRLRLHGCAGHSDSTAPCLGSRSASALIFDSISSGRFTRSKSASRKQYDTERSSSASTSIEKPRDHALTARDACRMTSHTSRSIEPNVEGSWYLPGYACKRHVCG